MINLCLRSIRHLSTYKKGSFKGIRNPLNKAKESEDNS
jgi:hypothetical protein